ncbi:hypothetical protein [Sinomicrobium sp. M5D2P9]
MKHILITLCFVWAVLTGYAQGDTATSGHMTFKGVPMDGTLNAYVSKMKKSGFMPLGTKDGIAMFTGDFAALKKP